VHQELGDLELLGAPSRVVRARQGRQGRPPLLPEAGGRWPVVGAWGWWSAVGGLLRTSGVGGRQPVVGAWGRRSVVDGRRSAVGGRRSGSSRVVTYDNYKT